MHRDRAFRHGSVTELADALEQFSETLGYTNSLPYTPTEPGIATPWPRTPLSSETRPVAAFRKRAMRRKALRKRGIELGVLLTLLAGGFFLYRHSRVDRPAEPQVATQPEPKPAAPPHVATPAVETELSAAKQPEESVARAEPTPPVANEPPALPTPPPAPLAAEARPVRPVAAAKRPTPPAPGAIAPAPAFANQPAPASRPSTRRTHGLSQADF
jgi:hypothetical protein